MQRKYLDGRNLLGRIAHELAAVRFAQRALLVPLQRVQLIALRIVVADQRDILAGQHEGGHAQRQAHGIDASQSIVGVCTPVG